MDAASSKIADAFLRIGLCHKSGVGSPIDEWRDQKFARKIERRMNIKD